jgi:chemosensory pili system protein ChpC
MPTRINKRTAVRKTNSRKPKKKAARRKAENSAAVAATGSAVARNKKTKKAQKNAENKTKTKVTGNTASRARASKTRREQAPSQSLNGATAPIPVVNCTLAPMETDSLLLPTNVIAEVVEYIAPTPIASTPQWFLGQIDWENRQVPVFSYSALISGSDLGLINSKARIMIVKSLSDSARLPYLGILINDIPRLISVQINQLVHTGDEKKSMGAFCHVDVQEQSAIIPDLDRLTHLVTHAAFGILPITQIEN